MEFDYKVLGIVETNKFRIYFPNKKITVEVPVRNDYCPPLSNMYTITEKEECSKHYSNNEIGYKVGDVITLELPSNRNIMLEDGITYRLTTQTELDRYESIYHPESDNAKVYNELIAIFKE